MNRPTRGATAAHLAVLAALAYVPVLATEPGRVAADTKAYLYLDPGRLLASALSSWDPSAAGGAVTFQNVGYLLPQGPFYWILAQLGVPVWVAQRLWLGTLLLAAGAGVWYLARVLGLGARRADGGLGPLVAGVVYLTSPYFLQYAQRISDLVLPWAGLGWMLAFVVLAVRRGGWRYPALFGLVVALVGGSNATALLYVGLAPALYLPYAVLVARETTWRRAVVALGKLAVFGLLCSLWWVAALAVSGAYGLDVLRYTETVPAVASTSAPAEVLRGLGYWFFYGGDELGPWLHASVQYETQPWLVATSFAVPVLAFLAAALVRWRHRAFFAGLVLLGLVLSVGTYPFDGPGFVGRGLKALMTGTTAGFALRSTDRATPLLLLGLAMLLGAGVAAVAGRVRIAGHGAALLAVGLAVANAAPLLTGATVEAKYTRPSQLPAYVTQAAADLDAAGNSTRVLFEPGESIGTYNFGDTNDSIWPGLLTRPTIERLQLIGGGAATEDLLEALDLTLQQGTFEPSSLAPVARLMSAGSVVLQSDLAYWAYGGPQPRETWPLFDVPLRALTAPASFGPLVGDDAPAAYENLGAATLALPTSSPDPPALAVFGVEGAPAIYRAEAAGAPLLVAGSGAGLVAAAATGLLDDEPTIFYAASLDGDAALAREASAPAADLLLTDSNALVTQHWTSVADNVGEVETSPPAPTADDPAAVPLAVFPGAPPAAYTVARYSGASYVTASSYGSPYSFTPEDRPYMAFDGSTATSWTVSSLASLAKPWIEIELPHPTTVDHVDLVQPINARPTRVITGVTLSFDSAAPVEATLGPASLTRAGQVLSFPARTFRTLRITIERTSRGSGSPIGFAEIRIPGVTVHEMLELPTDLLSRLGTSSLSHRLTIVVTRIRVGSPSPRSDPENTIERLFALPTARSFTISGTARIGTGDSDQLVDQLLGGLGGTVVRSSGRLAGDLQARGVAAFDGDSSTAWMPDFGASNQLGAWVEADLPRSVTFDQLQLQVDADGRHSVPTAIRISTETGAPVTVPVPPIADSTTPGATAAVTLHFPAVTGRDLRFTIASFRAVRTRDYESGNPVTQPIGIAGIGVPGVRIAPEDPAAQLPDLCRTGLVSIDGQPVSVRIEGTVGEAESGSGLRIVGCGSDAGGVALAAGSHTLVTTRGGLTGIDVDRLVLDSAAGGAPMPLTSAGDVPPAPGALASPGSPALPAPAVKVLSSSSTSARLEVTGATEPFWLVMGQSQNPGWTASVEGGAALGASVLVDAMSNGWYVTPASAGGPIYVDLTFTPQGKVDAALAVSAGAILVCLALAVWPAIRRRRRRRSPPEQRDAEEQPPALSGLTDAGRRPAAAVVVLLSLVAGLVAAALPPPPAAPFIGIGAAVATAIALTWSRGRVLLKATAVACVVAVALDTAIGQLVRHLHAGAGWPTSFPAATTLTWIAVIALALDAAVERARQSPQQGEREGDPAATLT